VVVDHVHAIRLANAVVDQVRRRTRQATLGHRGGKRDPLYRIRKLLLTRRLRRRRPRGGAVGEELFFSHVHLHGGPAPVRRFLPQLIDLIWNRRIDPGKVFDWWRPMGFSGSRGRHKGCPGYSAQAEALRPVVLSGHNGHAAG
jgi:Transposase